MISRGTFQPQLLCDSMKHIEVFHLFGGLNASVFLKIFKLLILWEWSNSEEYDPKMGKQEQGGHTY